MYYYRVNLEYPNIYLFFQIEEMICKENVRCHDLPMNKSSMTMAPKSGWLRKKLSNKDLLNTTLQSGKRTNKILGELSEQENVINRQP